jgi:hypothetical protein
MLGSIHKNSGSVKYIITLSIDPEAFDVIPGTKGLRVAKTKWYEREGIIVPPLKVWFTILDEDRVLLRALTIEESI